MNFGEQDKLPPKIGPKEFFLNLGWLISLYATLISFMALAFGLINNVLEDTSEYYRGYVSSGLKSSLSWLIIVFPIFLIISFYLVKSFTANSALRQIWIRKWMIFFTLFVSSISFVVDLVMILNKYLDGDLTWRFFAKALTVLIVAVLVFYYFTKELKAETKNKVNKLFTEISVVLIVGLIVSAFIVIGSPQSERDKKFDEKRVADLQGITRQINRYYYTNNVLPDKTTWIEDLKTEMNFTVPIDPQTNAPYLYEPEIGTDIYTLCANFNSERKAYYPEDEWTHQAGEDCFIKKVNLDGRYIEPIPKNY